MNADAEKHHGELDDANNAHIAMTELEILGTEGRKFAETYPTHEAQAFAAFEALARLSGAIARLSVPLFVELGDLLRIDPVDRTKRAVETDATVPDQQPRRWGPQNSDSSRQGRKGTKRLTEPIKSLFFRS